jgi:ethanolamine utilization protein EutA (predicted chaperonin)
MKYPSSRGRQSSIPHQGANYTVCKRLTKGKIVKAIQDMTEILKNNVYVENLAKALKSFRLSCDHSNARPRASNNIKAKSKCH